LYGYLLVPHVPEFLQPSKQASSTSASVEENKRDIATGIVEAMDPEMLYLLGPGTTVKAIADELGVPKTLLGVDAVYAGQLVGRDLPGALGQAAAHTDGKSIIELLQQYSKCKIVVTPLGGNGFIFGRGNKQFTPEVIRQVGKANIIVVSTAHKVRQLSCLRVDTGDLAVDEMLNGYIEVTIGYRHARVMKVCH
jgi:predicted polyphosphate/ATP-dependent NAD kinase